MTATNNLKPDIRPAECVYYPKQAGFILRISDWQYRTVDGAVYRVPYGFWSNGGSIPSAFWAATFSPFDMRVIEDFMEHDWAYTSHCCDKTIADHTLLNSLRIKGFDFKATLVAGAVEAFGRASWKLDPVDKLYARSLRQDIIESGRNPSDYCL